MLQPTVLKVCRIQCFPQDRCRIHVGFLASVYITCLALKKEEKFGIEKKWRWDLFCSGDLWMLQQSCLFPRNDYLKREVMQNTLVQKGTASHYNSASIVE